MANRHFGEFGDIWKHLPLMEVLGLERPGRYVESHAGSAVYGMDGDWKRAYGVGRFFERGAEIADLRGSAFWGLLNRMRAAGGGGGALKEYPGSPRIAMEALGAKASYVFHDLDGGSLESIRECAKGCGVGEERVRVVRGDGNVGVMGEIGREEPSLALRARQEPSLALQARRGNVFVMLDPYRPMDSLDGGPNSAIVFAAAAAGGVKSVLWYGFDARSRRAGLRDPMFAHDALWEGFRAALRGAGAGRIWRGDVFLRSIDDVVVPENPGVMGCGIACANLSDRAIEACERLGKALATAYEGSALPGGASGALDFDSAWE